VEKRKKTIISELNGVLGAIPRGTFCFVCTTVLVVSMKVRIRPPWRRRVQEEDTSAVYKPDGKGQALRWITLKSS
jgi:hypothetical protein